MKAINQAIMRKLVCLLLFALSFSANAQNNSNDDAIMFFIGHDSVPHEILGYFYETRSPLFSDPDIPKFIVASRDRKFAMGIGGFVLIRASYDIGGICTGRDFQTFNIPVPNAGNPRTQFQIDASASRLFTRLRYHTEKFGDISGYIEGDFLGTSRTFRLRQAYIGIGNFIIGQTMSTFLDISSFAPSLDQNGTIVATVQRSPLIRYFRSYDSGFGYALSLELPVYSGTDLNPDWTQTSNYPSMPDYMGYVQYKWDRSHIRLSGMARALPYKDVVKNEYTNAFGFAVKLSSKMWLSEKLACYYHAAYGKGYSAFLLDVNGSGVDIISDPDKPGKMFAPRAMALYGGGTYYFSKKVYSSMAYGYTRLWAKDSYIDSQYFDASTFYDFAQAATANVIWNFLPSAFCGLEYWWGERNNYDGQQGHANRIYASIRYNF